MSRLIPAAAAMLAGGAAAAHPAIVAHDHPHGASALLGLDIVALVALGLVVAGGAAVAAVRRARGQD